MNVILYLWCVIRNVTDIVLHVHIDISPSLLSLYSLTLFPLLLLLLLLLDITCVVLCNDDEYKRCLVESLLEPSYAYIQLIDYGHSEMVSIKR